jgi:hypothetical protein
MIWLATESANCRSVSEGSIDHELGSTVEDLRRRAFLLLDEAIGQ